jgi:hypothetical protein
MKTVVWTAWLRFFQSWILIGALALSACGGDDGGGAAKTVRSIEITPATASIAAGTDTQFQATAIYSDESHADVTDKVTWSSSSSGTAKISNDSSSMGLATGLAVGSADITAALGSVTSPAVTLKVTAATLVSIAVTPATPSIPVGVTQQFTATGTFSDRTTQDLTTQVTWSSSSPGTASISNASGSEGLATGVAVGSTDISAALGSVTSTAVPLNVTAATLVSIAVTPAAASIPVGLTQQFVATGTYTDQSTQDLTTQVSWNSDTPGTATVSNASGSKGLATGVAIGTTNVSATLGSVTSPTVPLNVTAATLQSIAVTPANPSIPAGMTQQFTAIGTYSDQSTQDLTTQATWTSDAPTTASVSNASGSNGLATGLVVGTANVSATLGAVSSPTVPLNVTAATLQSIAVTPANPSISVGQTQQFTATGTYSDQSTQDLTTSATWASDTTSVATISNASGSNGLATAVGNGTANISATQDGVTGGTGITVAQANAFTTPGTYSWTVPAGVSSIQVVATGGGGGGGAFAGGNGGVVTATLSVSPSDVLAIQVGGGGAADMSTGGGGGASSVNVGTANQIIAGGGGGSGGGDGGAAPGGNGGGAGTGAGSTGSVGTNSSGGAGGNGGTGGAAGSGINGVAGGNGNGGAGGAGGQGAAGGAGVGTGTGGAGGSMCCGGGGGGGYGGGGGAGSGPGYDGGGGGGGSVGPAGATYSVSTNGGLPGVAGGDGSVVITTVVSPP